MRFQRFLEETFDRKSLMVSERMANFSQVNLKIYLNISTIKRSFCNWEIGTEESAAHADNLGNSRKLGEFHFTAARLYIPANLSCFRLICIV